ncbi:MAG: hypothetical protein AABX50_02260 [Nanoarchaeota archaeon]
MAILKGFGLISRIKFMANCRCSTSSSYDKLKDQETLSSKVPNAQHLVFFFEKRRWLSYDTKPNHHKNI